MFDDQIALERSQNFRGWATRFFAPIESVAEADLVIREMSFNFAMLAAVQAVMAFFQGSLLLVPAAILLAAALLFRTGHALAALAALVIYLVVAFVFVALMHGKPGSILWYAIIFMVSWRATRTITRRRSLLVAETSSDHG